ncbi:MAG: hypothetical protein R3292_13825, partial [Alcanivorax sp.]|nr:hypothetical protein [Alcanivorax sp.]
SLSNSCQPTTSLSSGASSSGNIKVQGNGFSDQVVVLSGTASSTEKDYRNRNNTLSKQIVFSNSPDLALSTKLDSSLWSNNQGTASVTVTVTNRSTINAASNVTVDIQLPAETTLDNANALGCLNTSPVQCPLGNIAVKSKKDLTLSLSTGNPQDAQLSTKLSASNDNFPTGPTSADITLHYKQQSTGGGGGGGGGSIGWLLPGLILLRLRWKASR